MLIRPETAGNRIIVLRVDHQCLKSVGDFGSIFLARRPGRLFVKLSKFTRRQIETSYNSRSDVEARGHYSKPGVYSTHMIFPRSSFEATVCSRKYGDLIDEMSVNRRGFDQHSFPFE